MINQKSLSSGSIEFLKWLGIFLMFGDHFVKIFQNFIPENIFYIITMSGRLVFPIFIFLIAWNYLFNTKSKKKYLIRLWLFAIISQPFYYFAFQNSGYSEINIFVDLAFGLSLIYLGELLFLWKEKIKNLFFKKIFIYVFFYLAIILNIFLFFVEYKFNLLEYSLFGSWVMIGTYLLLKVLQLNKIKKINISLILFIIIFSLFFLNYNENLDYPIATLSVLPLITFLFFYKQINIKRSNKYIFYLFYPLHLFFLKLLFLFF